MDFKQKLGTTMNAIRLNVSAYHTFVFLLQLVVVLILTLLSPFFIRALCLPSLVQFKAPLHFTFLTCSDHLSGVCSYPTATVILDEDEWRLTEDVQYDVGVDLLLSEVENNKHLGPFQVIFEAFDSGGQRIASYRRTAKVNKQRHLLASVKYMMFLPLYLFGLWREESDLDIRVTFSQKFIESASTPTNSFTVQLQNRLAEIDGGNLIMRAHFGLFRNFLVNWPLLSALVICSLTFSSGISIVVLYWAHRGLMLYLKCSDPSTEQSEVRWSRASSLGISSGFHSYGSMDSLYNKDDESVFKDNYFLKNSTIKRTESERIAAGETSIWEMLKRRKEPTGMSRDKQRPIVDGSKGWDMKRKATPEQLATFLESLIERSPQDMSGEVTNLIQSLIDESLSVATVTIRLRKLVDVGDRRGFISLLRKSLPSLRESMRKGEITIKGIRPIEASTQADQEEVRKELQVSEDITVPSAIPAISEPHSEIVEMIGEENGEAGDDEVPECPMLVGIPGWDVKPEPVLRRRPVHKRDCSF